MPNHSRRVKGSKKAISARTWNALVDFLNGANASMKAGGSRWRDENLRFAFSSDNIIPFEIVRMGPPLTGSKIRLGDHSIEVSKITDSRPGRGGQLAITKDTIYQGQGGQAWVAGQAVVQIAAEDRADGDWVIAPYSDVCDVPPGNATMGDVGDFRILHQVDQEGDLFVVVDMNREPGSVMTSIDFEIGAAADGVLNYGTGRVWTPGDSPAEGILNFNTSSTRIFVFNGSEQPVEGIKKADWSSEYRAYIIGGSGSTGPDTPDFQCCECELHELFLNFDTEGISWRKIKSIVSGGNITHTIELTCDADGATLVVELTALSCSTEDCQTLDLTGTLVGGCEVGIIYFGNGQQCATDGGDDGGTGTVCSPGSPTSDNEDWADLTTNWTNFDYAGLYNTTPTWTVSGGKLVWKISDGYQNWKQFRPPTVYSANGVWELAWSSSYEIFTPNAVPHPFLHMLMWGDPIGGAVYKLMSGRPGGWRTASESWVGYKTRLVVESGTGFEVIYDGSDTTVDIQYNQSLWGREIRINGFLAYSLPQDPTAFLPDGICRASAPNLRTWNDGQFKDDYTGELTDGRMEMDFFNIAFT